MNEPTAPPLAQGHATPASSLSPNQPLPQTPQKGFVPLFVWTDGPWDKPNRICVVTIIRPSDNVHMFIVRDPAGAVHEVHVSKLKLQWSPPNLSCDGCCS